MEKETVKERKINNTKKVKYGIKQISNDFATIYIGLTAISIIVVSGGALINWMF